MAKHFAQEVTGNDSVGEGHHLFVDAVLSDNGGVDGKFTLDNHVALTGFCAVASLWFFDDAGNVVAKVGPTERWCVDGRHVFWGESHRTATQHWQIDPALVPQIQKMAVIGTDPGKNPLDNSFLKQALALAVAALSGH